MLIFTSNLAPVPNMTYNVFGGTLNLALSIYPTQLIQYLASRYFNIHEININDVANTEGVFTADKKRRHVLLDYHQQ